MTVSKAQQRSVNKYIKNNYDCIHLTVKKGKKAIIKKQADIMGISVNQFINDAINEKLIKENVVFDIE